jgi:hypothetical protein
VQLQLLSYPATSPTFVVYILEVLPKQSTAKHSADTHSHPISYQASSHQPMQRSAFGVFTFIFSETFFLLLTYLSPSSHSRVQAFFCVVLSCLSNLTLHQRLACFLFSVLLPAYLPTSPSTLPVSRPGLACLFFCSVRCCVGIGGRQRTVAGVCFVLFLSLCGWASGGRLGVSEGKEGTCKSRTWKEMQERKRKRCSNITLI